MVRPCCRAITLRVAKRAAVADPLHVVHDRDGGVAGPQEVRSAASAPTAVGRDRGQAARSACAATWPPKTRCMRGVGLAAPVQVHLELLELEQVEQLDQRVRHGRPAQAESAAVSEVFASSVPSRAAM